MRTRKVVLGIRQSGKLPRFGKTRGEREHMGVDGLIARHVFFRRIHDCDRESLFSFSLETLDRDKS